MWQIEVGHYVKKQPVSHNYFLWNANKNIRWDRIIMLIKWATPKCEYYFGFMSLIST